MLFAGGGQTRTMTFGKCWQSARSVQMGLGASHNGPGELGQVRD